MMNRRDFTKVISTGVATVAGLSVFGEEDIVKKIGFYSPVGCPIKWVSIPRLDKITYEKWEEEIIECRHLIFPKTFYPYLHVEDFSYDFLPYFGNSNHPDNHNSIALDVMQIVTHGRTPYIHYIKLDGCDDIVFTTVCIEPASAVLKPRLYSALDDHDDKDKGWMDHHRMVIKDRLKGSPEEFWDHLCDHYRKPNDYITSEEYIAFDRRVYQSFKKDPEPFMKSLREINSKWLKNK